MNKKLCLVIAVLVLVSGIIINHAVAQGTSAMEDLEIWKVRQGDTLWDIANQHRGRTDVRKYIFQIKKLNDIDSNIYPGQELFLPPTK